MQGLDWVPGTAIAVVSAALLFWRQTSISDAVVNEKLRALSESGQETVREQKETADILRDTVIQLSSAMKEQGVINTVTTKALDSILTKLDNHAREIAEHGASMEIIRQFITRPQANKTNLAPPLP